MKGTVDDLIELIKQYIDAHDENQCWEEHNCLSEIQKEIDNIFSEWAK